MYHYFEKWFYRKRDFCFQSIPFSPWVVPWLWIAFRWVLLYWFFLKFDCIPILALYFVLKIFLDPFSVIPEYSLQCQCFINQEHVDAIFVFPDYTHLNVKSGSHYFPAWVTLLSCLGHIISLLWKGNCYNSFLVLMWVHISSDSGEKWSLECYMTYLLLYTYFTSVKVW